MGVTATLRNTPEATPYLSYYILFVRYLMLDVTTDRKISKEPANTLIKETQKQSKYII